MRRLLGAALAVALLAPSTAVAADRDRDRMPDAWERANGLAVGKKDARRDRDRDGLRNRAELRTAHDPRDRDSDDDGIRDGRENAGRVIAFDGAALSVRSRRKRVVGRVDADTTVACRRRGGAPPAAISQLDEEGPDEDSDAWTEEDEQWLDGHDEEDDGSLDDLVADFDADFALEELADALGVPVDACPAGALTTGAIVHEALRRGGHFDHVVLLVA